MSILFQVLDRGGYQESNMNTLVYVACRCGEIALVDLDKIRPERWLDYHTGYFRDKYILTYCSKCYK